MKTLDLLRLFRTLPSLMIFGLFFHTGTFAQEFVEPCASGNIHEDLILNDPQYERSFFYLQAKIEEYVHGSVEDRNDDIYTIPVVVHIIHEGEAVGTGSNISDAQIFSAIEALNDDYRKVSGSAGDGEGVDVGIEYCLASRDPDGNSTTGIVRVDGSVIPDYAEMGIEANGGVGAVEEDVKALSTWPKEEYINIWIVNEIEDNDASGGIQGFAYFPIDSPIDGVCILHNAFGTVGNLKPNTDENRTATHELGHFFGLYHTFHGTMECGNETNCETQGDHVCDTPETILNVSCTNPACENQIVENYMDYTPESCKNMFTQGQKDRMRATLESDRSELLTSLGCVPATDNDAGISGIIYPTGTLCGGAIQPEVFLTNFGSDDLTSVTIEYGLNGSFDETYEWSGNLEGGLTTAIVLPSVVAGSGSQVFMAKTVLPNGLEDEYADNDQIDESFEVSSGDALTLDITLDYFGTETTWEILDETGESMIAGGPYVDNSQGTTFTENVCLASGCYDLIVYDDFGDGMGFTNGYYALNDADGTELVSGGGNFGDFEINNFCFEQVISEPEIPTALFTASDFTICAGSNVDFFDQSTESPTSWDWTFEGADVSSSDAQHPQNIYFQDPGTYSITLTVSNDAGSDTYTTTVTVSGIPEIALTSTNPSCFDSEDGEVSAVVVSDDDYSIQWNTGSISSALSNLPAGVYEIEVTSDSGCSASSSVTLTENDPISISFEATEPTCFGSQNGSVVATVENAEGPVDYEWDNGMSGAAISDLFDGSYSLTVTDANSCQSTASVYLNQPAPLEANLTSMNIGCSAEFGSALVNPTGGNGAYQANWSDGNTGLSNTTLEAGSYSVSVSDMLGCSVTASFEITASESLELVVSAEDISCFGLENGSASVTVYGGSGGLTYDWSTGETGSSIENLSAGEYEISVVDDAGCEGNATFIVAEPETLELAIFKSDISCYGLVDGEASCTASGGTSPYGISWSNGSTEWNIENLAAGTYTANVIDDHGCMSAETISIVEPSEISLTTELIQAESCAGSDGSGVANAMGGTYGFNYDWSNGSDLQTLEDVSAGIYDVIATDANGCQKDASLLVPFDCEMDIPTTQLTESDCESTGYTLNDYVTCDPIDGAEMYQWRFVNESTGLFYEIYTIGSNNSCALNTIQGLHYDMSVYVSVRLLDAGNWSAYGDECIIWMDEETPGTEIHETTCNTGTFVMDDILNADIVEGANTYGWKFSKEGQEDVYKESLVAFTYLTEDLGLIPNTEYDLSVRVKIGPNWSDYSASCSLFIEGSIYVDELENETITFNIFPNPNDGTKISIESSNLFMYADVSTFELFNGTGQLIETFNWSEQHNLTKYRIHTFKETLSPGMYILRCTSGSLTTEQKLIVR